MADEGFNIGDSVKIEFADNSAILNIPNLTNCFFNADGACLVSDGSNVSLHFNNQEYQNLVKDNINKQITLCLETEAEYKKLENYMQMNYSFDANDYESDEVFANFREISCARIKSETIFKGASPCSTGKGRCYTVDRLLEANNIANILDLSENKQELAAELNKNKQLGTYYKSLVNNNKTIYYKIGGSESKDKTNTNLAVDIIDNIANAQTPVYIHCFEGKDRTGPAALAVKMLAGSTYDEIVDDYMLSYKNYYNITNEDTETYEAIRHNNLDATIRNILNMDASTNLQDINFKEVFTEVYLNNGGTKKNLELFQKKFVSD